MGGGRPDPLVPAGAAQAPLSTASAHLAFTPAGSATASPQGQLAQGRPDSLVPSAQNQSASPAPAAFTPQPPALNLTSSSDSLRLPGPVTTAASTSQRTYPALLRKATSSLSTAPSSSTASSSVWPSTDLLRLNSELHGTYETWKVAVIQYQQCTMQESQQLAAIEPLRTSNDPLLRSHYKYRRMRICHEADIIKRQLSDQAEYCLRVYRGLKRQIESKELAESGAASGFRLESQSSTGPQTNVPSWSAPSPGYPSEHVPSLLPALPSGSPSGIPPVPASGPSSSSGHSSGHPSGLPQGNPQGASSGSWPAAAGQNRLDSMGTIRRVRVPTQDATGSATPQGVPLAASQGWQPTASQLAPTVSSATFHAVPRAGSRAGSSHVGQGNIAQVSNALTSRRAPTATSVTPETPSASPRTPIIGGKARATGAEGRKTKESEAVGTSISGARSSKEDDLVLALSVSDKLRHHRPVPSVWSLPPSSKYMSFFPSWNSSHTVSANALEFFPTLRSQSRRVARNHVGKDMLSHLDPMEVEQQLFIWHVLASCGHVLSLSPFWVDELDAALRAGTDASTATSNVVPSLLVEIHMALLNLLAHDRRNSAKSSQQGYPADISQVAQNMAQSAAEVRLACRTSAQTGARTMEGGGSTSVPGPAPPAALAPTSAQASEPHQSTSTTAFTQTASQPASAQMTGDPQAQQQTPGRASMSMGSPQLWERAHILAAPLGRRWDQHFLCSDDASRDQRSGWIHALLGFIATERPPDQMEPADTEQTPPSWQQTLNVFFDLPSDVAKGEPKFAALTEEDWSRGPAQVARRLTELEMNQQWSAATSTQLPSKVMSATNLSSNEPATSIPLTHYLERAYLSLSVPQKIMVLIWLIDQALMTRPIRAHIYHLQQVEQQTCILRHAIERNISEVQSRTPKEVAGHSAAASVQDNLPAATQTSAPPIAQAHGPGSTRPAAQAPAQARDLEPSTQAPVSSTAQPSVHIVLSPELASAVPPQPLQASIAPQVLQEPQMPQISEKSAVPSTSKVCPETQPPQLPSHNPEHDQQASAHTASDSKLASPATFDALNPIDGHAYATTRSSSTATTLKNWPSTPTVSGPNTNVALPTATPLTMSTAPATQCPSTPTVIPAEASSSVPGWGPLPPMAPIPPLSPRSPGREDALPAWADPNWSFKGSLVLENENSRMPSHQSATADDLTTLTNTSAVPATTAAAAVPPGSSAENVAADPAGYTDTAAASGSAGPAGSASSVAPDVSPGVTAPATPATPAAPTATAVPTATVGSAIPAGSAAPARPAKSAAAATSAGSVGSTGPAVTTTPAISSREIQGSQYQAAFPAQPPTERSASTATPIHVPAQATVHPGTEPRPPTPAPIQVRPKPAALPARINGTSTTPAPSHLGSSDNKAVTHQTSLPHSAADSNNEGKDPCHESGTKDVASLMRSLNVLTLEWHVCLSRCSVRPLGKDRYFNKYFWLDSVMPDFMTRPTGGSKAATPPTYRYGLRRGVAHSTSPPSGGIGRILVQSPDLHGLSKICQYAESSDHWDTMLRLAEKDNAEADGLRHPRQWSTYDTPAQLDALVRWLNPKGQKEGALRHLLLLARPYIVASMAQRWEMLNAAR